MSKQNDLTTKLKELDQQAHGHQCSANELAERLGQIPAEVAELENALMKASDETEIDELFERIEGLRKESRRTNLLARKAEIERLLALETKHNLERQHSIEEYTAALDKMPELLESAENAKRAVENQESLIARLAGKVESAERALTAAQVEKSQLQNLSVADIAR